MSDLLNISAEERQAIRKPATDILVIAEDFKIVNHSGYEAAGDKLQLVKGAMKDLAAKKKTLMAPLNEAVAAARALFAEPEGRLERAERLFKAALVDYQEVQERERREAQRLLDEAARKEREKAEAEARAAQARADAQRKAAEEAKRAGDAAEAARLAKLAEANEVKAEAKQEAAQTVVAATVQQEAPKVSGIATREVWSAVVLSLDDLVLGVAAGIMRRRMVANPNWDGKAIMAMNEVPLAALEANSKFLNNQAKALKKELAYPGVRAVVEKSIAAGAR